MSSSRVAVCVCIYGSVERDGLKANACFWLRYDLSWIATKKKTIKCNQHVYWASRKLCRSIKMLINEVNREKKTEAHRTAHNKSNPRTVNFLMSGLLVLMCACTLYTFNWCVAKLNDLMCVLFVVSGRVFFSVFALMMLICCCLVLSVIRFIFAYAARIFMRMVNYSASS